MYISYNNTSLREVNLFDFDLKGAEIPAEFGLTEILSTTHENSFDLVNVDTVLNFWANLADNILNSSPKKKHY